MQEYELKGYGWNDFDASFLIGHLCALCSCGQDAIYDNKEVPKINVSIIRSVLQIKAKKQRSKLTDSLDASFTRLAE